MSGATVLTEKWPVLGRHEQAAAWLTVWADLGRAPRTIDAYGRGLAEYLLMCERDDVDPATAGRAHIAVYVRELSSRPHRRGVNVVSIDSGAGLSNATIQWRKSSYSGSGANECVEVAPLDGHDTGLRDSKDPARGHLELRPAAWTSLIDAIKYS